MVVEMAIFRQRQPRRRRPEIFLMEGQYNLFTDVLTPLLYFNVTNSCPRQVS